MKPSSFRRWGVMAAVVSACLAGCTTIEVDVPDVDVDVPDRFAASPGTGERANLGRWWERFGDPVLSAYIEEGLRQNADVRVALARVMEARAYTDVARSAYKPTIDASAAGGRGQQDGAVPAGALMGLPTMPSLPMPLPAGSAQDDGSTWGNGRGHSLTLAWEADVFGGLRSQAEMVRQLSLGAREQVHGAQLMVASDIASRYIEARSAEKRVRLLDEGIQVAERLMAYAKGRYKAGQATSSDVERAELEWRHAQAKREPLQALLHSHLKRLAVLMGRPPQGLMALPPETQAMQPPPLPDVVPSEMLERRPDVRGAARKLRAQAAKLGTAKAARLPRFFLGLGILGGRISPDDEPGSNFGVQRLGIGVRLPIFHGGRISANIAANEASLQGLAVEYEKTILTALEDVENAYVAQQAFVSQHLYMERAAELARRVANHQQALFVKGQALLQPALEAQAKALERDDDRVRADNDRLIYTVTLYKALGGGWQAEDNKEAKPVQAAAVAVASAPKPATLAAASNAP